MILVENQRLINVDYFIITKIKNKNMNVENKRKINSDDFIIQKTTMGYNFNLIKDIIKYDDYYIYKSSNKQRQVTVDEFLEFKNCGYIFFKKDLYSKEWIDMWIEYIISIGGINYISKPLPPFHPSKINIIK